MFWWLGLAAIALVAFVVWDFRRFQKAKLSRLSSPEAEVDQLRRRVESVSDRAPPPASRKISEQVSVVLRKQIPPRDEPLRSWIGGLPSMPDGVSWPRSVSREHPQAGERPLHFVAQIACADLPAEFWGGLGPREGWLLLFLDPNQGVPEGEDAFKILHVGEGAERAAPADLGPVHDGVYSGPRFDHLLSNADVPKLWRRWPVDLVVVPNEAREESGRTLVTPEGFAATLYDGLPVAPDRASPADPEPFTWRGALYALDGLGRSLAKPLPPYRVPDALVEKLDRPGYIAGIAPILAQQERDWLAANRAFLEGPAPEDEPGRKRHAGMLAYRRQLRETLEGVEAFLLERPTTAAIVDYLREAAERRSAWHERARQRVAAERAGILRRDLDAPIDRAEWEAVQFRLAADELTVWTHQWVSRDGDNLHVSFEPLVSRIDAGRSVGGGEIVADYYVDRGRRRLIPPAVVETFEPYWRQLLDNRPHRMGGYHDGVQSDAQVGPTGRILLFQIASDPAMNWWWGDVGAIYVFVRPDDLERLDFSKAEIILECY